MVRFDIVLNNRCNFKCSYCCGGLEEYQSNDTISPMNISRLVYYINKKLSENDYIEFNLLGGEPLLYPYLNKIYDILSQCKTNKKIRIDTNGSIIFPSDTLHSITACGNNQSTSIEVYLTYHAETLDTHKQFLENYYNNIIKLLDNNVTTIIRLLYSANTFDSMQEIKDSLSQDFPCLLFEWRKIFDIQQKPIFLHDYYCLANNYIGVFPSNKLFYSCEYEIKEANVKSYNMTKENISRFISNINVKRQIQECRSVYSCPSKLYLNKNRFMNYNEYIKGQ